MEQFTKNTHLSPPWASYGSMKTESCHNANSVITGVTGGCHLLCYQWLHYDSPWFSVNWVSFVNAFEAVDLAIMKLRCVMMLFVTGPPSCWHDGLRQWIFGHHYGYWWPGALGISGHSTEYAPMCFQLFMGYIDPAWLFLTNERQCLDY